VEAFADDTTPMAKLEESAISAIKNILNSFAIISGLKCNVEKSQIIITGTRNIPGYVLESGFSLTEKLKILGFDITKNSADLQNNFENAIKKNRKNRSVLVEI
jgi:hypothetical protein